MQKITLVCGVLRRAFLPGCLAVILVNGQTTDIRAQNASATPQDPAFTPQNGSVAPQNPAFTPQNTTATPQNPAFSPQDSTTRQPSDPSTRAAAEPLPDEAPSDQFNRSAPQSQNNGPSYSGGSLGAVNGDYVLQSGDTIEMIVYREQDLTIRSKIGKNNMVELPLIGQTKIGGLSVQSATSLIRERYNAHYLVQPQIYLSIIGYNVCKFTIIGQVGKPGTYEFNAGDSLDFLQAIGLAGGFTRDADQGHIVIKRREGNEMKTLKVNVKQLTSSGGESFKIQPGDVITVSERWF